MTKLTVHEFIESYKNSPAQTMEWISKNPAELSTLFTTREDIELLAVAYHQKTQGYLSRIRDHALDIMSAEAQQLHKEMREPIDALLNSCGKRIASLYENSMQFMQLLDKSYSMAKKLFEKEPTRIGALFATHADFMQLLEKNYSLAKGLLDSDTERFALLFNTQSKFNRLKEKDETLGSKVAKVREELGLQFLAPVAVEPDHSAYDSPFSKSYNSVFFEQKTVEERMRELDRYNKQHPVLLKRQPPPKPNNHFGFKCLMGLALVGGIAAIIAGVILAQPELTGLGACVSIGAAICLYSLFNQNDPHRNALERNPDKDFHCWNKGKTM